MSVHDSSPGSEGIAAAVWSMLLGLLGLLPLYLTLAGAVGDARGFFYGAFSVASLIAIVGFWLAVKTLCLPGRTPAHWAGGLLGVLLNLGVLVGLAMLAAVVRW